MVVVQSLEEEANVVLHKEAVVAHSSELGKVNNDKDKGNSTTREVAEAVEVDDLAGEIMTNHNEIEILLSQFVLAGL